MCERVKEQKNVPNESENTHFHPKNKQLPYHRSRAKEWEIERAEERVKECKSGFYFTFISMHCCVSCKSLFSVIWVHFGHICVCLCARVWFAKLKLIWFPISFRCFCLQFSFSEWPLVGICPFFCRPPAHVFPRCHFCNICVSLVFISLLFASW